MDEVQLQNKINKIGPDLLNDQFTLEIWKNKITWSRIKSKQICGFLMEQKYFSGIGNYLKSDILYLAAIRPDRSLMTLTDEEITRIFHVAVKTIRRSYHYRGCTIKSYWDPDGKAGKYERIVYGKTHDQYGNEIIKSTFKDKRTTHWVPSIQK